MRRTDRLALQAMSAAVAAVALLLLASAAPASGAPCGSAPPLQHGDVINVALLVWLPDAPYGLCDGEVAGKPGTAIPGSYGTTMVQPHLLGLDLYVKRMRAAQPMPLANRQSVSFNFVYINMANASAALKEAKAAFNLAADYSSMGQVNFAAVDPATNFPLFMVITQSATIPGGAAFTGNSTLPWAGLFKRVTSQDPAVLAEFGISSPFTFIIPTPLLLSASSVALYNMVEDAQSAIVIHPFASNVEDFICDGRQWNESSLTPDCTHPRYGRNRLEGARRFETLFSTLVDSTGAQQSALETFHMLGIKTIGIIIDAYTVGGASFAINCAEATKKAAALLNIEVVAYHKLDVGAGRCPGANGWAANCPPSPYNKTQTQVWPKGQNGLDAARAIATANPDALIIMGSPNSPGSWAIATMFNAFHEINWTPKAVSYGGGIENSISIYLHDKSDIHFSMTTAPWDPRLKGPQYSTKQTATSFELFQADAKNDAPGVFQAAYDAAYGPAPGRPRHPFWTPSEAGNTAHALGAGALTFMQKMVEKAMTADVPTLITAAKSISVPTLFHQADFDVYGRTSQRSQMLRQYVPSGGAQLIWPYNVGVPAVYPLPTWEERVFKPEFYSETNEKIMVAINSVCLALLAVLLGVVIHRRHSAVIKAASPLFCALTIVGCALMLASNYFNTLVVNNAHCAASAWLLSIGFSITFSALFVKTFRLWRIFFGKKLQVLKIRDVELLGWVGAFVLVDIIINAAWAGTAGMATKLVVTDPIRPGRSYLQCDYSDAMGAVYAHVAVKAGTLLIGMALTWAVRNTPSQFNESTLIGIAIYNVSFVICFVLPILSADLGGRKTIYLIRNFAVMFVALSTSGLLYFPKLLMLTRGGNFVTKVDGPQLHTHLDSEQSPSDMYKGEDLQMSAMRGKSQGQSGGGGAGGASGVGGGVGGGGAVTTAYTGGAPSAHTPKGSSARVAPLVKSTATSTVAGRYAVASPSNHNQSAVLLVAPAPEPVTPGGAAGSSDEAAGRPSSDNSDHGEEGVLTIGVATE